MSDVKIGDIYEVIDDNITIQIFYGLRRYSSSQTLYTEIGDFMIILAVNINTVDVACKGEKAVAFIEDLPMFARLVE